MYCDARSIYVLKTMEFLDFGEILRGAERAQISTDASTERVYVKNCNQ